MTERSTAVPGDELIDVRRAAALTGRHPETIRRWIWSGRLTARRQGIRLLVARADVEAMAPGDDVASSLREWVDRARTVQARWRDTRPRRSAADLVIEDRTTRRSQAQVSRARR